MTSTTLQTSTQPKYGLPAEVRFCRRCTISNQRPNSCNEFEHTAASAKQTIHFDADGVCSACRVAERKDTIDWTERERELRTLLDRHRSTDGSLDVIVPGSGGKDSFYTALKLKHDYGMHPLLVTWAPSLYTDIGRQNLEAWQSLGPHILATPNREVNRLLVRLSLENLFHPFACFIYGQKALAPKLAEQHGIGLVMYGESEAEYGNPALEAEKGQRDRYHHASGNVHLGGVSLSELHRRYGLTHGDLGLYLPPGPEALEMAEVHYLGYYLRWHPQSAFYAATEHGFEPAPERSAGTYSKYSSLDDRLDDWHYMTSYVKFGIGRATYDSAQEVRSGDITREEGVSLVKRYDGEYPERFEQEVFKYLSVDGFAPMSREYFWKLADKFRSDHLWEQVDGRWSLRHTVFGNSGQR